VRREDIERKRRVHDEGTKATKWDEKEGEWGEEREAVPKRKKNPACSRV